MSGIEDMPKAFGEGIMYIVGIDPGITGAIAFLGSEDRRIRIFDFEDKSFMDELEEHCIDFETRILIEKQQAMPKQGVSSTFKIGENYGWWQGYLIGLELPFTAVTAREWQKVMYKGVPASLEKKERSLEAVRRLFPELTSKYFTLKKHHNRADALLIAEFCNQLQKMWEVRWARAIQQ